MKKIILSVFTSFLCFSSFGQWTNESSGTVNNLTSVVFTSPTNGYAVDITGGIHNYNGTVWSLLTSAANGLNSVSFGNSTNGSAVGLNGGVMNTNDGGATWSSASSGQGNALNSVFYIGPDTACAVGAGGTIVRTTNAGSFWFAQTSGTSYNLHCVFFTDVFNGFAVGDMGTILHTTDGGATWTSQTSGTASNLYGICFSGGYGFAVGQNGILLYTNNAGANWYSTASGTVNNLYAIRFVDAYHGFAVGAAGTIIRTNDAGGMWYTQTSGTSNDLNSVFFTDVNNGRVVGTSGTIMITTDGGCVNPSISISGTNTICYGDSTTLTASGATDYRWNAIGGNAITNTTTIAPFSSTAVTVVGTSSDGCVDSAVYNITVNSLPIISTFGGGPLCSGATATLTASGATTYTWSTSSIGSTIAVSPVVTTTYSVTGTDANSCVNTDTVTVTVMATPSTPTAANNGPVCDGQSLALTASNVGGATYSWSGPNGFSSTSQNPVIPAATTLNAGTYSVIATVSGCTSSAGVTTVVINALPTITISGTSTLCAGNSVSLLASGGVTYNWSPATGLSCTGCSGPNVSPATTTSYSIDGTDANGCMSTVSITITVNALPSITASAVNASCNGLCDGSVTASGAITYTWIPGGMTSSSITNQCAGTYTVIGIDANGCSNSATATIMQPTAMSITFGSLVNATCIGVTNGSVDGLVSGGVPAYTYAWSEGSTSQTVSGLSAGNYTLVATDANSCTATGTVTIGTNTTMNLGINGPTALCQGQSGQLTYTTSGGTAPYMPDWFDYVAGNSFCMGDTALFTPLQPFCGQDTVKLTLTDNSGCIAYAYQYIQVGYGDSLSGLVSDTALNPVNSGVVYLFQQKTNHVGLYDTLTTTPINSNGTYSFPNVPYGEYFLKVVADTSAGFYPTSVGTYYSNKPNAYQWDSALVINHHTCTASNINGYTVTIIEIPATVSGPGVISGYITQGAGFGQRLSGGHNSVMGAPLKGVDIKLGKNPGGSPAARTTSDTTTANAGFYSFTNVPVGSYKIYVDIPNYGMDSVLIINITSTSNVSTQNNYYVDSVMIRVDSAQYIGISPVTHLQTQISVYPNPAHGNVTVTSSEDLGIVTIYNPLGEVIFKEKINSTRHQVDLGKQASGVYILHAQDRYIRIIKE